MPTIQRFGAVSVRMYPDDHRPPHFHIAAPDFQVLVRIADLERFSSQFAVPSAFSVIPAQAGTQGFQSLAPGSPLSRERRPIPDDGEFALVVIAGEARSAQIAEVMAWARLNREMLALKWVELNERE